MNKAFGRDTTYVSTIGLSQIAGAQMLHVFGAAQVDQRRPGRPAGLDRPGSPGRGPRQARTQTVVALSGDYDFQFMIEELAVGAQFNLPYIHVVVNNSYLGLIRQSQRGFKMEQNVSLAFENINSPGRPTATAWTTSRWPRAWAARPSAWRTPTTWRAAFDKAKALMGEFQVPVVVEVILEKITNISMGVEINAVNEFEELAETAADAPTAILATAGLNHADRASPRTSSRAPCPPRTSARHLETGPAGGAGGNLDVLRIPVADGGEGTLDAAVGSGFTRRTATVSRAHRPAGPGRLRGPRTTKPSSKWPQRPAWPCSPVQDGGGPPSPDRHHGHQPRHRAS